jgi:hypothetical protein
MLHLPLRLQAAMALRGGADDMTLRKQFSRCEPFFCRNIVESSATLGLPNDQASTNMDVSVFPILGPIWTDYEGTVWTDTGWRSKWVHFARKGDIHCGVTHYASCSGVA